MSQAAAGPGINHSRGCIIRQHPTGLQVVMYYDNPGVYYDARGLMTTDTLARAAGFDVAKQAKERAKQQRMTQLRRGLDAEFEAVEDRLARVASEGAGNAEVRHVGNGKYAVYDGEERITPFDLGLDEATALVQSLRAENSDGGDTQTEPAKAETQAATADDDLI